MPHYTPKTTQQRISSKRFISRDPTELHYLERSVFRKDINAKTDWIFRFGLTNEIVIPIDVVVGFQERFWRNNQQHKNYLFVRLPGPCAQCCIRAESYPDAGIKINFADDKYSQCYG